jgi:Calcineurin-like phosphoesterase
MSNNTFNLWTYGDAHVPQDMKRGRESLAEAFRQSEGTGDPIHPSFDWDIAIDVGDNSASQGLPTDEEGLQVLAQYDALTKHRREDIYSLCGNHDRNGLREPEAEWFRRWLDPMGVQPKTSKFDASLRPHPTDGTWERYSFRVGNILFLIMSDVNEPSQIVGRGDLDGKVGGNPSGVVSQETFDWWRDMVLSHPDEIIVTAHHYVLKDTTVASGSWEGMALDEDGHWRTNYHGLKPESTPDGASYLYWVGGNPNSHAFQKVLESNPGCVDLWLGGHTHASPVDTHGGKSHIEQRYGVHFVNVCGLTRHHGHSHNCHPMSRLFTFEDGSDQAKIRCYLHNDSFAPVGWFPENERTITLSKPFQK